MGLIYRPYSDFTSFFYNVIFLIQDLIHLVSLVSSNLWQVLSFLAFYDLVTFEKSVVTGQ